MNSNPSDGQTYPSFGVHSEQSYSLVLLSGLATTCLALLGVYVLDRTTDDFHIMGWYANYVIPAGALIVGLAAASGYGLASWFSGIKITSKLLWMVLALQVGAYFAAQYIEFANLHLIHVDSGKPVSFFEYYDFTARSFAWQQDNGSMGEPLGAWGYFFRALEIVGFAGGGLIVPALLRKAPYCADCRRYMRTRQLMTVSASAPARKVKKSDAAGQAAYAEEQQKAMDAGRQSVEKLAQLAVQNQAADFKKVLEELAAGRKAAAKLLLRFNVQLIHCSRCCGGRLRTQLLAGQGNQIKTTEVSKTDLHPEFVRAIQP